MGFQEMMAIFGESPEIPSGEEAGFNIRTGKCVPGI